ncbi:MAG: hypothetical protein HRT45_00295 [Bdellovibrionales bacterium]|nr:hypothetical protein [Bdellovibrionales bacterium]
MKQIVLSAIAFLALVACAPKANNSNNSQTGFNPSGEPQDTNWWLANIEGDDPFGCSQATTKGKLEGQAYTVSYDSTKAWKYEFKSVSSIDSRVTLTSFMDNPVPVVRTRLKAFAINSEVLIGPDLFEAEENCEDFYCMPFREDSTFTLGSYQELNTRFSEEEVRFEEQNKPYVDCEFQADSQPKYTFQDGTYEGRPAFRISSKQTGSYLCEGQAPQEAVRTEAEVILKDEFSVNTADAGSFSIGSYEACINKQRTTVEMLEEVRAGGRVHERVFERISNIELKQ